jgi:hypothetical protein
MILVVLHALALVLCGLVGIGTLRAMLPDLLLVALGETVMLAALLAALACRRWLVPCRTRARPPRWRRP